jgi:hypothetical protein
MASQPPVDNTLVEALARAFRWRRRFVCAVAESPPEISPADCGTPSRRQTAMWNVSLWRHTLPFPTTAVDVWN